MAKLHELHFELLLHPSYSPDLAASNYWLFADHKRMLQGKRFGSNEEVILETEVYFEAKDNYWLFADHKRMLQGKRFGSNEEVILETEVYFEAKDKSFYKKASHY